MRHDQQSQPASPPTSRLFALPFWLGLAVVFATGFAAPFVAAWVVGRALLGAG